MIIEITQKDRIAYRLFIESSEEDGCPHLRMDMISTYCVGGLKEGGKITPKRR